MSKISESVSNILSNCQKLTKSIFNKKTHSAILVIGMHRSGTSMLMKLCSILGVSIGNNHIEAREDNEKGFWEHKTIVELNEKVFETFKLNSQDVIPLPDNWINHPEVKKIQDEIIRVINHDFNDYELWGIKDPRICKLMPMWNEILKKLNINIHIIIPFRHPLEVARSLMKRDFISFERGILLWLQYNLDLEKNSRNFNRSFVFFNDLLENPSTVVNTILQQSNIELLQHNSEIESQISGYIDPKLQHNKAIDEKAPEIAENVFQIFLDANNNSSINTKKLDSISQNINLITKPIAETISATNPEYGDWRNTKEAKDKEIAYLKKKLDKFETK